MQDSILGKIGKGLAIYLGGSWAVIEASSFVIERYGLDAFLIEILMIILVFIGIAYVASIVFPGFNRRTIPIYFFIAILMLLSIGYQLINPAEFTPSNLRVLKLSSRTDPLAGRPTLVIYSKAENSDQDGISIGFERGIRTNIQRLDRTKVISKTTVLAATRSNPNLETIRRKLDVDHILEIYAGVNDTLFHIELQLFDQNSNEPAWAQSYDGAVGEFASLSSKIAELVDELIHGDAKGAISVMPVVNKFSSKSLAAYYKAQMYAGSLNREGFDKAELLYEESIREDSSFVSGYAGLATVWVARKQVSLVPPQEADLHIRELISKAMEVDELDAQTWAVKGAIEFFTDYDFEAGLHSIEQSLHLDPGNVANRATYAHTLMILGRWEEAWTQIEYTEALDPYNPVMLAFKAIMEINNNKFLSAARTMETLGKLIPDHPFLGLYKIMKANNLGQDEKAIAVLKPWISSTIGVPETADVIQEAFDETGSAEETISRLVTYLNSLEGSYVSPFLMLQLEGNALGRSERSIHWIEKMYEERNPNMPYLTIPNNGFWRSTPGVETDPRVRRILEAIDVR